MTGCTCTRSRPGLSSKGNRGIADPLKPYYTAIRTLRFGRRLLEAGEMDYRVMEGVARDMSAPPEEWYTDELSRLNAAFRESRLPAAPDEQSLRYLLFTLRVEDLEADFPEISHPDIC